MRSSLKFVPMLVPLVFIGTASAATITVACSVVSSPTELSANLVCPEFSGLNLQNIAITIDGSINGSITLTNNGTASNTGAGTTTSQFTVGPLSGFTILAPLFSATFTTGTQTLTAGQSKTFSGLSGMGMATITDNSVFGPYEGAGNFMIPVSTLTGLTITGGGGNFAGGQSTSASATASVVYTFASGVPEVGTITYLSTGLGAIVLGLLRRRSR